MSVQLKRKFALCGVLLAFAVAAVPTFAAAQNGADDPAGHVGHGGHGGDDAPGHK
jgi:hypothetical protein